jgi:hypothetical protein
MRICVLFVLIAIVISVLSPVNLSVAFSRSGGVTVLMALDVCHGGDPPLTVDAQMPSIHESPCTAMPLAFAGCCEAIDTTSIALLFPCTVEHPPRT